MCALCRRDENRCLAGDASRHVCASAFEGVRVGLEDFRATTRTSPSTQRRAADPEKEQRAYRIKNKPSRWFVFDAYCLVSIDDGAELLLLRHGAGELIPAN